MSISVYLNEEERIKISKRINSLEDEVCKLDFIDIIIPHKSASESIVGIGEDTIIKLSFDRINYYCDNTCTEREVYSKYIPTIIEKTPHIIIAYSISLCPNFLNILIENKDILKKIIKKHDIEYEKLQNEKEKFQEYILKKNKIDNLYSKYNEIIKQMFEITKNKYDFNKARLMVLEKGSGISLADRIDSNSLSIEEFKSIFFQIFYTLSIFAKDNFRHNDLHPGNILIEESNNDYEIIYYVSDLKQIFKLKTNVLVKIFDFDRSNWYGNIKNEFIDKGNCECHGECNDKNTKYDMFTLLSILYDFYCKKIRNEKSALNEFIIRFCKEFIDRNLLIKFSKFKRLCNIGQKNEKCKNSYCHGDYEPDDKLMKNPIDVIKSDHFNHFREKFLKKNENYYSF